MACVTPLRLSVALDGAGWHPAARREPDAASVDLLSPQYWAELVVEAERGKLDFVTIEDSPSLDAARIAALVAPLTSRIGLVPAVTAPRPEPSTIATAIAALDVASSGRAGWRAPGDLGTDEQVDEAADVVEAVRRAWESSPSVEGRPVVAALAHSSIPYRFAAGSADVVLVTPADEDDVRSVVTQVRAQESAAVRTGAPLRIFADLVVFLDDTEAAATDRKTRLDELSGAEFISDAAVFVGTPAQLMRRLQAWQRAGIEGFRLRPGALPHDLRAITRGLVPALQENDAFRRGYEAKTLRALLGLPRAVNRSGAGA